MMNNPSPKRQVMFWQNIPSFHQSAHIRALAEMSEFEVTLVAQEELPKSFRDAGWTIPDFGKAKIVIITNHDAIDKLMADAGNDAIHIFSGIRFPMVRKAFHAAIKTKARIGLLSEAADWRGIRGFARFFLYTAEILRFGTKIDFVLAIGHLGVRWYSKCGVPAKKIYPYGYFVERSLNKPENQSASDDFFRLAFVGQCIYRKGIDILLDALATLKDFSWHLVVVGDGPELTRLKQQALKLGVNIRVTFHGAKKNKETLEIIAAADLLVLPSRWDGWGAVVNEALMQGVPVVCSDKCGAADLLQNPERGEVFKSGSVLGLQKVLERRLKFGKRTPEITRRLIEWSRKIEGETAAKYLIDILKTSSGGGMRPVAPWFESTVGNKP
ncbi:MAG: glycosyltransferase [Nitrospirota bacterium]